MQISCFTEILGAGVAALYLCANSQLELKSSCTLEAGGERRVPRLSGPHGPPELIPNMLLLQKDCRHYWCGESPLELNGMAVNS